MAKKTNGERISSLESDNETVKGQIADLYNKANKASRDLVANTTLIERTIIPRLEELDKRLEEVTRDVSNAKSLIITLKNDIDSIKARLEEEANKRMRLWFMTIGAVLSFLTNVAMVLIRQ